ncbi:MAG: GcrA family cell cycle regulator [Bdellovibrionales bacterium]
MTVEAALAQPAAVYNANDNAGVSAPSSWSHQDPVLRDLWSQNLTPDQIADKLGRSVAAIMTRAARLGLPRRFAPGRKPIVRAAGTPAVRQRPARTFTQEMFKDVSNPAKAMRMCLMCTHPFQSHGSHNRICPKCKGSPDYESGSRLGDVDYLY